MRSIIHEGDNRPPDERLAAFRERLTDTLSSLDPRLRSTVLDVVGEVTYAAGEGVQPGDLGAVVDDALRTVEEREFQREFERHKLEATTGG